MRKIANLFAWPTKDSRRFLPRLFCCLCNASRRTTEFADAVISRLGLEPKELETIRYDESVDVSRSLQPVQRAKPSIKELVGVDVFVHWTGSTEELASRLKQCEMEALQIQMITNRGVKVWPNGMPEKFCTDHWRCRLMNAGSAITHGEIVQLLESLFRNSVDFIKMENLCTFDGQAGYSLGQGQ